MTYWERLDAERSELGRSRRLALRIDFSYSAPLWNSRYRLHLARRGVRWAWTATEQATGRVAATGRSWTLGGAVWAAERAAGA